MNLVAKEFVAARNDESGVPVFGMFTGAARDTRRFESKRRGRQDPGSSCVLARDIIPAKLFVSQTCREGQSAVGPVGPVGVFGGGISICMRLFLIAYTTRSRME